MAVKNELQHELINLLQKLNEDTSGPTSKALQHDIHLLKTSAFIPMNLQAYYQVCYYLMLLIINHPSLMTPQNKAFIEEFQSNLKLDGPKPSNVTSKSSTHKGK